MSKREKIFWAVECLVVTVLLEVASSRFISYNLLLRGVTSVAWFCFLSLYFADVYWIKKKQFVQYHLISAKTSINFMILILLMFSVLFSKNTNYTPTFTALMVISIITTMYFVKKLLDYNYEEN